MKLFTMYKNVKNARKIRTRNVENAVAQENPPVSPRCCIITVTTESKLYIFTRAQSVICELSILS